MAAAAPALHCATPMAASSQPMAKRLTGECFFVVGFFSLFY
jgi:hypothetical protein